jgi:hypothetical protein
MQKTSAQEWAKRIRRWQRSGLPAREFGQRHGIDPKQLSWWKWHLKKRGALQDRKTADTADTDPDGSGTAIRLLPVQVINATETAEPQPSLPHAAVVEVGLRNGRVVRVAQDADLGWLAELLMVVEAGGGAGC